MTPLVQQPVEPLELGVGPDIGGVAQTEAEPVVRLERLNRDFDRDSKVSSGLDIALDDHRAKIIAAVKIALQFL